MRNLFNYPLAVFLLVTAFVLSSCTVHQRKYLPGFDVQRNTRNHQTENQKIRVSKGKIIINAGKQKFQCDPAFQCNDSLCSTLHLRNSDFPKGTKKFTGRFTKIPVYISIRDTTKRSKGNNPQVPPNHPRAVNSMFAAAIAFSFLLAAMGFFVIPVLVVCSIILAEIGGVAAIVNGRKAKQEIKVSPEKYSGRGLANIGLAIGWIIIGISLLILLLLLLLALAFA